YPTLFRSGTSVQRAAVPCADVLLFCLCAVNIQGHLSISVKYSGHCMPFSVGESSAPCGDSISACLSSESEPVLSVCVDDYARGVGFAAVGEDRSGSGAFRSCLVPEHESKVILSEGEVFSDLDVLFSVFCVFV